LHAPDYIDGADEQFGQKTQNIEEEKLKEGLQVLQDLLKNEILSLYDAHIVKQPELKNNDASIDGEGKHIAFEIDTDSFGDTH